MDNGLRLAKFNTENGFKFFDLARHLYINIAVIAGQCLVVASQRVSPCGGRRGAARLKLEESNEIGRAHV